MNSSIRRSTTDRVTRVFNTHAQSGGVLVPLDPAARNIPFGGKMKGTFFLLFTTLAILASSIVLARGFAPYKENPMVGPTQDALVALGAMTRYSVIYDHQYWKLIWSAFMHAGFLHFGANALSLVFLGSVLEPDWGAIRFLSIFFIAAVVGNSLSVILDEENISLGSSGGIFGHLTALLVYILGKLRRGKSLLSPQSSGDPSPGHASSYLLL